LDWQIAFRGVFALAKPRPTEVDRDRHAAGKPRNFVFVVGRKDEILAALGMAETQLLRIPTQASGRAQGESTWRNLAGKLL
jgi:hypothetical protein